MINKNTFSRKILLIALCLVTVASLFTACSGQFFSTGNQSAPAENQPAPTDNPSADPNAESNASAELKGEGLLNNASMFFATIKDENIFYKHPYENQVYKLNTKTGETEKVGKDTTSVMNNNGTILYLEITFDTENQSTVCTLYEYSDGDDIVIFSDNEAIIHSQLSDGYLYYLKSVPDMYSGYASRIYRAKLEAGSSPELVCDVLCNSFYVNGNTLYYGDVASTSLMETTVEAAMNAISTAPLSAGQLRNSADIAATEVIRDCIVRNLTIVDNVLYYIDSIGGPGVLRYCDLESNTVHDFNFGINTYNYNIYENHIYYSNMSDYAFYRMNLDGTEITKISPANYYGHIVLSNGKFITKDISTSKETEGFPYLSVCDLEGNVEREISFDEFFKSLMSGEEDEEYYDDYAFETESEETESIDTTIDMED